VRRQTVCRPKRAALIACLNGGGSLHKQCGAWAASSGSAGDKPIFGITVADLGRDGMLTLCKLAGTASARLTTRGSWFCPDSADCDGGAVGS